MKRMIGRRLLATMILALGFSGMFGLGAGQAQAQCSCSSTSLCASAWLTVDGQRQYVVDNCSETGWEWLVFNGQDLNHAGYGAGYFVSIPIP